MYLLGGTRSHTRHRWPLRLGLAITALTAYVWSWTWVL